MTTQNEKYNWYFTFGSDPGFPFQSTFIIIEAETKSKAIRIFRQRYPDRHENTVNCAFIYSEDEWHGSENEKYYGLPAEIIKEEQDEN